jgi:alginate O-acetyltransferase complex protein AlgI
MEFNSTSFLFFFVLVGVLYFGSPFRLRWVVLLCASYYFYMCWKPEYLFILIGSTLANYYAGIRMGRIESKLKRKKVLAGVLLFNLGVLFLFKYFSFFNQSLRTLFDHTNLFYGVPALRFLQPIGISFYTFKNMSYAIDVYRGNKTPEQNPGIYALYVAFFPQLLAGPIERATRLLPQFHEKHPFDAQRVTNGLRLMLWGFFEKMVIGDTLATLVDPVFNHPTQFAGPSLVLASVLFAFQIYYDFSGYSDIAIGAARILGYETMANFNRPYASKSISEFWRRWHISLSTWFRDYLYIPLGGNRVSVPRWSLNLFIVFLLCGLWHGASWTFVVWGGLHGFYLVFSNVTRGARDKVTRRMGLNRTPRLHHVLKGTVTFSLVCFAWIFFRANSFSDISYILRHLFTGWGNILSAEGIKAALAFGPSPFEWIVGITALGLAEGFHLLPDRIAGKPALVRWAAYYGLILGILLLGQFDSKQFIYFQF